MENAFRDGEIKTAGTDIDKLMPPVSRFGGGGRAKKKQGVIDKLKTFFEKYFGIGGSSTFTEPEHKIVTYDLKLLLQERRAVLRSETEAIMTFLMEEVVVTFFLASL